MSVKSAKAKDTAERRWLSYRPEIKVLDCTIRDGGLVNDHKFEDGFIRAVYDACVAAGIDYMEIGYKNDRKVTAQGQFGVWKFCDEDDVRRIVGDNPSSLKLAAMIDAQEWMPDCSLWALIRSLCHSQAASWRQRLQALPG